MTINELPKRARRSAVRWYRKLRRGRDLRYIYSRPLINVSEFGRQVRRALAYLKEARGTEGVFDYLEFGVCHGTSMIIVERELDAAELGHVRLFGFDSFQGLPADSEGRWHEGAFKSDLRYTKRIMTRAGVDWSRTRLIKGWFSDTLNAETVRRHGMGRVSLVTVDCDIYSAAKEALDFCGPLLDDTAVVIFDDWNPLALKDQGEKRAFDEFLAENPQLRAEPFGDYSYKPGDLQGKLFVLRRVAR